jgi:ABC-type lipoprotein export system ATPase subunit
VGFIFQFYNLMPVLTAFENVELPLLLTSLDRASAASTSRRAGHGRLTDRMPTTTPTSSPAASSSAWPLPAHWSPTRR